MMILLSVSNRAILMSQSNIKWIHDVHENRKLHTRFRRFWVVIISPVHSDSVRSGFHSIEYIHQTNRGDRTEHATWPAEKK